MKRSFVIIVALLGLILVGSSNSFSTASATGSDPIFMQIPGIDGEVTAVGHEKQIELNSFSFGVSNTVSHSTGGAGAGKAIVSDIAVIKFMDKSSPLLFSKTVNGAHIPQVDIYFVKTSGSGLQTYAHYVLKDVLLSSYSVSSGGDRPSESLSLNFAQIQFEFTSTNPDGTLGSPITAGWDIALNKAI